MTVTDLKEQLCLKSAYTNMNCNKLINGCYVGDYLSYVIKNSKPRNLWLTVVNNPNTVAVAMLKYLSSSILCENVKPTDETIKLATERGIPILLSTKTAYQLAVEISKVI